jgi:D-alanyl-lipoteichoic acid acyltransferase DltB (MBOAT superfamily)
MFFNSSTFLFLFLPITLGGFVACERLRSLVWSQAWVLGASLVFYGWSNPAALGLLLPVVVGNYFIGSALQRQGIRMRRPLLWGGVALNLLVLGYFKYANFLVENLNSLLQTQVFISKILLPLGISFVTFMQIAWLVASSRKEALPCSFFEFLLYATFFPQLVSGPIVYEKETMPQFRMRRDPATRAVDFCVGATLFTIGLSKKVLVADTLAPWATQAFWAVGADKPVSLVAAWIGALAYTFQLYYDFSGYSDMALGAARLFGIRLPLNFNSPYRATSISDFWRRWHMTLSRFLKDYLYIPLGGNRCGRVRRSTNLFVTMLLGGFWHGAGWTFLLWGGLHGGYLVVNHAWSSLLESRGGRIPGSRLVAGWGGRIFTFLAVLVAWIFFRATHFTDGCQLLLGMSGANGFVIAGDPLFYKSVPAMRAFLATFGATVDPQAIMATLLGLLFVAVWFFPNSQQILAAYDPGLLTYGKRIEPHAWTARGLAWRPTPVWLAATALVFLWSLLNMSNVSSFLYRDF